MSIQEYLREKFMQVSHTQCELCEESFENKLQLELHLNSHHPFRCLECRRTFLNELDAKKHATTHIVNAYDQAIDSVLKQLLSAGPPEKSLRVPEKIMVLTYEPKVGPNKLTDMVNRSRLSGRIYRATKRIQKKYKIRQAKLRNLSTRTKPISAQICFDDTRVDHVNCDVKVENVAIISDIVFKTSEDEVVCNDFNSTSLSSDVTVENEPISDGVIGSLASKAYEGGQITAEIVFEGPSHDEHDMMESYSVKEEVTKVEEKENGVTNLSEQSTTSAGEVTDVNVIEINSSGDELDEGANVIKKMIRICTINCIICDKIDDCYDPVTKNFLRACFICSFGISLISNKPELYDRYRCSISTGTSHVFISAAEGLFWCGVCKFLRKSDEILHHQIICICRGCAMKINRITAILRSINCVRWTVQVQIREDAVVTIPNVTANDNNQEHINFALNYLRGRSFSGFLIRCALCGETKHVLSVVLCGNVGACKNCSEKISRAASVLSLSGGASNVPLSPNNSDSTLQIRCCVCKATKAINQVVSYRDVMTCLTCKLRITSISKFVVAILHSKTACQNCDKLMTSISGNVIVACGMCLRIQMVCQNTESDESSSATVTSCSSASQEKATDLITCLDSSDEDSNNIDVAKDRPRTRHESKNRTLLKKKVPSKNITRNRRQTRAQTSSASKPVPKNRLASNELRTKCEVCDGEIEKDSAVLQSGVLCCLGCKSKVKSQLFGLLHR